MAAITKDQILQYTGGSGMGADILAASKKYGFTASDVDNAFGFTPGYSQSWIDSHQNTGAPTAVNVNQNDPLSGMKGYTAATITADPKSTVQQQVSDITRAGGPLMQEAETRGLQSANRRGLINSSIATESAQKAVLDSALPIAQQDASTNFNTQIANQNATNRASEVTVDAANQAAQLAYNRQTQQGMLQQQQTGDMNLQTLRGNQQTLLDQQNQASQRVIAAGNNAAYLIGLANQQKDSIRANPDMTPDIKQQQIDQIDQGLNSQLAAMSSFSGIDVSHLLNFGGTGTGNTASAPTVNKTQATWNNITSTAGTNENTALNQMYDYAVQNNMSKADIARQLGISEDKVQLNLDKIGKTL